MSTFNESEWTVKPGQNIAAGEVLLPRLIVKQSALEHNIQRMAQHCREHGVSLAPHAKTTMSPGIMRRQAAAGAWGFAVATVVQAQTLRQHGFERFLIANEVVEPRAIAWLAAETARDPRFEVLVVVDSPRGVSILESVLAEHRSARRLGVLIELGEQGKRAGCRTDEEAIQVADAVKASQHLYLTGLEGFEAVLRPEPLRAYLKRMRALATRLANEGYLDRAGEVIVSVGSTEHIDTTIEALVHWTLKPPVRTLLRPGSYATNRVPPGYLRSLEIWGAVLSRPEPRLAIVGFGRRDVPEDETLPTPTTVASRGRLREITGQAKILHLYDQHAVVELADTELEIGEILGCSLIAPYNPAFATWRTAPLVDDRYNIVEVLDVLY